MCDYLLPHREVWLFNLLLKIHNNVSKCWDDLFLFLCEKKKKTWRNLFRRHESVMVMTKLDDCIIKNLKVKSSYQREGGDIVAK